ncbi:MAG: hypothetical protein GY943_17040 [Chloroflexi bacterium]|nr:hypothetical protein [Chloroflexota bacterium]
MKIIYLDNDDDIVSICDRLEWANTQQLLLILPADGIVLQEGLDLVRLRRYSDRIRVEIGLVTADVEVRRQATALGIPTFTTINNAETNRRGWWRGRRRRERVGVPTVGGRWEQATASRKVMDEGDRAEAARRLSPGVQRRQWVVRYAAILLFCATISLLYVSFVYTVPAATITLHPETVPLRVEQQIVADPTLSEIDFQNSLLPARLLVTEISWQAEVETTGIIDVPNAPARGSVLFVNLIAQTVEIPVNTRVSTSDGSNIIFQTVAAVTIPDVVGSTAEIEVIAVEPGPQGNVDAGLINRVEGALATQVEVRNLDGMTSGGVRQQPAVSDADQTRLRSQVEQFLHALAASEMEAQLTEREFLTRDSLRIARVVDETYSHSVGEQTAQLTLAMRVEMHGTAVNTTEASGLAYAGLAAQVPLDFTLVPDSIRFESGNVIGTDGAGRVTFIMIAEATASANLNLTIPTQQITGQEREIAAIYLQDVLPLAKRPSITTWPIWFNRIPYTEARIEFELKPEIGD